MQPRNTTPRLGMYINSIRRRRPLLALGAAVLLAALVLAPRPVAAQGTCPPLGDTCSNEVMAAFGDVRAALTTHISGPQQTGLVQRLDTARDSYIRSVPGGPPILPPNPVTPAARIVLSIDTEVQALSCSQQPGSPPITPAGVVVVRASIAVLLERLVPSPPPIRPEVACAAA